MKSKLLRISDKAAAMERIAAASIPEPNSGCHLWIAGLFTDGYPQIEVEGRKVGAHRVVLACLCDELPAGVGALHSCDTRSCVNGDHIRCGTSAENFADMMRRGRSRHHGMEKRRPLTMADAGRVFRDSRKAREIAKDFAISTKTVSNIKTGRCYSGCERLAP